MKKIIITVNNQGMTKKEVKKTYLSNIATKKGILKPERLVKDLDNLDKLSQKQRYSLSLHNYQTKKVFVKGKKRLLPVFISNIGV